MYQTDQLEIWNLAPGITVRVEAQPIFNVVGRLKSPDTVQEFHYSLNAAAERAVYFNRDIQRDGRLRGPGDFNIDTLMSAELQPTNILQFRIVHTDGTTSTADLTFYTLFFEGTAAYYRLDLSDAVVPAQVGQVVDGRWRINRDEQGEVCIELSREDAGYDRIILFGQSNWTSNYEVFARISLTSLVSLVHNTGLLFKWNLHGTGGGTSLPTTWNTGLGYYSSNSKGLRIRYGVNVSKDEEGNQIGSYVLGETELSPWRHWIWQKRYKRGGPVHENGHRLLFSLPKSQMVLGVPYHFHLVVRSDRHTLTVWQQGKHKPNTPQIVIENPTEWLAQGSVGVIAYHSAVRIYDFLVLPSQR